MFRDSFRSPRRVRGCIMLFPVAPLLGFMAAIAIPAYQDYTIRAQTIEGLNLASAPKAAVAESYAQTGHWPADLEQAGMPKDIGGRYVASVRIHRGTVVIVYGRAAHPAIAGKTVTLRPGVTAGDEVLWSCGYRVDDGEDPASGAAGPRETTVPSKFLPKSCRGD